MRINDVTGEEQWQDDGELVDEMPEDVLEHGSRDKCHVTAVRLAIE